MKFKLLLDKIGVVCYTGIAKLNGNDLIRAVSNGWCYILLAGKTSTIVF